MLKIAVPILGEDDRIRNYLEALTQTGAEPVTGKDICPKNCDGLLLPGGIDVDPSLYGQEKAPETEFDRALDDLQLDMFQRFLALDRPIFGICRGHQVINVALGGTLIQHLPTVKNHKEFSLHNDNIHACTAEPDSLLAGVYGTRFTVNSSHHQGVDRPGDGLRVVLRSDDGVVEAMEHESLSVCCVQFHPERMAFRHSREDTVDGSLLFRLFLKNCGLKAK